jgi:hypothetical protein
LWGEVLGIIKEKDSPPPPPRNGKCINIGSADENK